MTEVYYVPELKNNLLSIGQLLEKGLTIQFEGITCKCKVYHPVKGLILECEMENNRTLLTPKESVKKEKCYQITDDDLT